MLMGMIRATVTLLAFAATVVAAWAAPRVALVRVRDIYTALPATAALQEELRKERDGIMKDPRAEDLRRVLADLQALQTAMADKDNPMDLEVGRKTARDFELKRQEAQALQKDFEAFRAEREKEINRRMVAAMRQSLNRILEISAKIGRERGYDLVLDGSGGTNTGLEFVLYQKQAPDLTDDVKAAIKDAAAASPPPVPTTEGSPSPAPSP
jgi:outer membrane protein